MAQISYDTLTITNIPDNLRQNFWVETTNYSSQIPAGVYITQNSASSFKNNPSGPNIFMQAANDNNGIRLRQGLLTLAEIMSDRFCLYTPNGSTQGLLGLSLDATDGLVLYKTNNAAVEKGLQLSSAGLEIFGSSQSMADMTVNSNGIKLIKGGIKGGTPGSATNRFVYLSTEDYGTALTIGDGTDKTDWRLIIGSNFGVDNTGKVYATSAEISGKISAESGYIGTATDGFIIDSYGFYVGTKTSNTTNSIALSRQLFTRTIDGTSRSDLCFAIGSKFAVDKDGNLYANGANITNINVGTITISDVSGLQNSLTYAQNNADYYFDDIANGVAVHNYTNTTQPDNRIEITSTNGLEIFNGGVSVAKYSTTARIGQVANDKSRVEITEKGIKFYNRTSGTDVVLAHIGYDAGIAEGGSTTQQSYPYYTFGLRYSDSSSTRGNYSFAEGVNTTASGYASHAEGYYTTASVINSHAEGNHTTASGINSHAEGYTTTASGSFSHAEGYTTTASGYNSHAEGNHTTAIGQYSHAEGYTTTASGRISHAEGYFTEASGLYSHAGGRHTTAQRESQTVIGEYNIADTGGTDKTTRGDYAVIVGNGTADDALSNALTVDWYGNIKAGGLDCGVVSITPTAGSVTSKQVTFNHTFSNPPYVVATAQSSVPGTVSEVCVSNVTTTGFTMYILRSTSTSTNIFWIAMYCG